MVAPTELVVPTDYSRVHNTMAPEEDAAMEDADPENVSGASDDDSDSASEDDSDSGSDSDDGDEDVAMPDESATAKIMKLERRLESDPGDYGAHVQLCASLREWPSLRRRLRDAREAFAERFPLNETQWREWISDEVRATKGRRKRRGKVVGALFERAVADYQSVVDTALAAAVDNCIENVIEGPRDELVQAISNLEDLIARNGHVTAKSFKPIYAAMEKLRMFGFACTPEMLERISELENRMGNTVPTSLDSVTAANNGFSALCRSIREEVADAEQAVSDMEDFGKDYRGIQL